MASTALMKPTNPLEQHLASLDTAQRRLFERWQKSFTMIRHFMVDDNRLIVTYLRAYNWVLKKDFGKMLRSYSAIEKMAANPSGNMEALKRELKELDEAAKSFSSTLWEHNNTVLHERISAIDERKAEAERSGKPDKYLDADRREIEAERVVIATLMHYSNNKAAAVSFGAQLAMRKIGQGKPEEISLKGIAEALAEIGKWMRFAQTATESEFVRMPDSTYGSLIKPLNF